MTSMGEFNEYGIYERSHSSLAYAQEMSDTQTS